MPGTRCAVVGCGNSLVESLCSDDIDIQRIQYYDFPDDMEIRKKWMEFVGREVGEWDPDFSHICSTHFTLEDYEPDEADEHMEHSLEKKVLKDTAVPSLLFLESSDQYIVDFYKDEMDDPSSSFRSNEEESRMMLSEDVPDGNADYERRSYEYEMSGFEDDSQEYEEKVPKRIACELCEREFSRKLALEHHLDRVHRLSESKISSYLQKVVHHSAQNYKCETCKRVFYKADKLARHYCVPAVAVLCEICKQKFTSKTGLKRHLLAVHQLGEAKVDSIMEELADYNARFYKKFKVAEDIVIHSSDGRVITKEGGSQFKTVEGTRCATCYKVFLDDSALSDHTCEPSIEALCKSCNYKAPTKYNLKRHLLLRHKLSEATINSALNEFRCYNEKWLLRTADVVKKPTKRKSSKRSIGIKHEDSLGVDFNSSKLRRSFKAERDSDFDVEERTFSDSDEEYNLLKRSKSKKIKTEANTESNRQVRKLVCEICQAKFPLRIALKRHLGRSHDLDAEVIDIFMERTLCDIEDSDIHSPEFNLDLDCNVTEEELFDKVDSESNAINPIDCEVCHQKLNSKKDLRKHLLKCFMMDESNINSIFEESKDYYEKFYGGLEDNQYDVVISSSDGRLLCKNKFSAFVPVPGPRCTKCKKAFEDEIKMVDHQCASSIKITCRICDRYSAPTTYKLIRHLVNVHQRDRDDVEVLLEEFTGYSTRLQLRSKKWQTDRSVKKEKIPREMLRVRVSGRSSDYFEEEKGYSTSESETPKSRERNKIRGIFDEEGVKSLSDSERLLDEVIKEERMSSSDDENLNSAAFENDGSLMAEGSDSEQDNRSLQKQENKEIVCEICKRKFCRRISLKKHLNTIHQLGRREIDYYLRRIAYESAANFKCSVCKKQFYKESRLASHDCAPAIAVVCELCQHKLTSKISLKKHLLFSHNLEQSKVNSILEELSGFNSKFYKKLQIEGDEIAVSSSDGRTICKKNGVRFRKYAGPRCAVCYKAFNEEEPESNHECATKIELWCDICKYKAPSKYNLRRHLMLIHKILQNEAKLAMEEFCRYSEKMELRDSLSTT